MVQGVCGILFCCIIPGTCIRPSLHNLPHTAVYLCVYAAVRPSVTGCIDVYLAGFALTNQFGPVAQQSHSIQVHLIYRYTASSYCTPFGVLSLFSSCCRFACLGQFSGKVVEPAGAETSMFGSDANALFDIIEKNKKKAAEAAAAANAALAADDADGDEGTGGDGDREGEIGGEA